MLSEILHYAALLFVFIVTKSWGIAGDNTLSCKECSVSVLYWLFLSKVSCILSLRVHFPANQTRFGLLSGKTVWKTCFSCYYTCSLDKEQKVCFQNSIWKIAWLLRALKKDIYLQIVYKPELSRRKMSSTDYLDILYFLFQINCSWIWKWRFILRCFWQSLVCVFLSVTSDSMSLTSGLWIPL